MQRHASLLRFVLVSLCARLVLVAAAGAGGRHAVVRHAGGLPFAGSTQSTRGGPRLDSALTRIAHSSRTGAAAALAAARSQKLDVEGQKVRVVVRPRAGQVAAARTLLRGAGATITAEADGLIEAEVWPGSLERLAGSGAVAQVRKPARPVLEQLNGTSLTSVTPVNEAVDRTSASAWQAAGYDGSGVKIAIIDGGFYGYQAELGAGLPASVTVIDHCSGNLDAPPPTGTEHGTAVAEIVHQMAPGAQLFLLCMDSEVGLAQSVDDAINLGVSVVNHSIGWFNTSRGDGTGGPGTPEYDVANARAHGITWVNAAGNTNDHWNGTFVSSSVDPDINDFAAGDPFDTVHLVTGQAMCVYLKWDEWPTTTNDYDLYLLDETTGPPYTVVAYSDDYQGDLGGVPGEALCYQNTGATRNFGISIFRYAATGSPRFDILVDGATMQYETPGNSVVEPASSPDAIAVGADCWRLSQYDTTVDSFNGHGPTIDGRAKPDIVAPDSVSGSVYGANNGSTCTQGFRGTSAASPHVAGAAALLLQRTPSLTPAGVEGALEATALSHRFSTAPDSTVGAGNLWLGAPTTPGAIAFSTQQPGSRVDVWTMNDDGTGFRDVASPGPSNGGFWNPSWSPDGSKLAFTSQSSSPWGVWFADANGANLTSAVSDTVSSSYGNAAFRGSGPQLSFDNGSSISLVDRTTDAVSALTAGRTASWSPDGTKVAYFNGSATQLLIADANGANAQVLNTGFSSYVTFRPAWSPDGSMLAFVNGSSQIWIASTSGAPSPHMLVSGINPQWSSDGTTLFFFPASATSTLMSIHADGTGLRTILPEFPTRFGGIAWRSQPRTAQPVATAIPVIGGEKRVGKLLHASTGRWVAASPMAVSYDWFQCNVAQTSCTAIVGAHDSSLRLTGALAGSTVKVSVTLTDATGQQVASSASTPPITNGTGGLPGAPTGVSATAGSGQAWVSFAAPASDGGSAIVAYTVTSSPGGQTVIGATSPIFVGGLTHQAYTFTVKATNLSGDGPPSAPSGSVTPAGLPAPPTGVGATAAADGHATVTFAPPADNGGATVTSYTATASPGGRTGSSSGSPITVNGLTNGVNYTFTVTATNSAGIGAASSASSPVLVPLSAPGAPTAVTAAAGAGQATVSFTPPASNGGAPITSYTVTSLPGGPSAGGSTSPITVTGLTNGLTYTFTVTATNSLGPGSASATSNAVMPVDVPGAPTAVTATAGDGTATIAFTTPANNGGLAIVSYTAAASPGTRVGSSNGSPVTVTGLTNGVSYTFTVTATNAHGVGPASSASNAVVPTAHEREHPEPPSELPRPDVPPFVAPGTRPPKPAQPS